MNEYSSPTPTELAAAVPPDRVRVLQIIYAVLAVGIITMAPLLLVLSGTRESGSSQATILSMVHAVTAFGAFAMGMMLFRLQLRGIDRLESTRHLMGTLAAAYLVRAALFEGPAIFGLVVLFLIGGRQLAEQPIYWANLASALTFLLMLAVTFPTTDRIRDMIRLRQCARPMP